jgi:hypothetical protein
MDFLWLSVGSRQWSIDWCKNDWDYVSARLPSGIKKKARSLKRVPSYKQKLLRQK